MTPAILLVIGLGWFAFALLSSRASRSGLTAPMAFTGLGLALGSGLFGAVDVPIEGAFIHDLAEVALAIALFTDASRIDLRRLGREHSLPIRLLAIGLPLTMLAGAGLGWLLFPALGLWGAVVLGIILAPTDAALGQAVVSDANVPQRIRQGLNVESGLNDGLAFPALLIAATLAAEVANRGAVEWAGFVGTQLLVSPVIGAAVAFAGSWAIARALDHGWMDETFLRVSTLAFPLIAYTGAEAFEGNGFIAAFSCGLVIGTRPRKLLDAIEDFAEAEGQLVTLAVFLAFGAVLLPGFHEGLDWRHVLYAILSLTALRMVPVALALLGSGLRAPTVAFLGWFGPRGLASIIYLLLIVDEYPFNGMADVERTVLVTVLMSIVLHGATAAPFARIYGRWSKRENASKEAQSVEPFPLPPGSRVARRSGASGQD